MTKQEEIREGVDRIIRHWSPTVTVSADWQPLYKGVSVGQDIMLYLHSQGVVIKVERNEPTHIENVVKIGYGFEPLIESDNG